MQLALALPLIVETPGDGGGTDGVLNFDRRRNYLADGGEVGRLEGRPKEISSYPRRDGCSDLVSVFEPLFSPHGWRRIQRASIASLKTEILLPAG